jgi:hypothetical protein
MESDRFHPLAAVKVQTGNQSQRLLCRIQQKEKDQSQGEEARESDEHQFNFGLPHIVKLST